MSIKENMTRTIGRAGLHIQKASPEILLGIGLGSIVVAGVKACHTTYLKADDILASHREKKEKIAAACEIDENYASKDRGRDLTHTYIQTGAELAKAYAAPIALGVFGLACVLSSYKIMKTRNVALMAAYNGLQRAYDSYRDRVRKTVGDRMEDALHNGFIPSEEEDKDGDYALINEDEKKIEAYPVKKDPNGYSQYARWFDEASPRWSKNPEDNLCFLKYQQLYFNDRLRMHGHVFLNEVYEALGIPHSSAGAVCGWVMDKNGNNYVDFGFTDILKNARAFLNGNTNAILLDFNIDGVIYDLI